MSCMSFANSASTGSDIPRIFPRRVLGWASSDAITQSISKSFRKSIGRRGTHNIFQMIFYIFHSSTRFMHKCIVRVFPSWLYSFLVYFDECFTISMVVNSHLKFRHKIRQKF